MCVFAPFIFLFLAIFCLKRYAHNRKASSPSYPPKNEASFHTQHSFTGTQKYRLRRTFSVAFLQLDSYKYMPVSILNSDTWCKHIFLCHQVRACSAFLMLSCHTKRTEKKLEGTSAATGRGLVLPHLKQTSTSS